MDWFTVPNLINAIIAIGVYSARSELSHIKQSLDVIREDVIRAHKRIDELMTIK